MTRVCIFGPSKRFLSGLSYYTIRLSNALPDVTVILFAKLLPEFLFPGKKRVGGNLSDLDFKPDIPLCEVDWNSPLSWFSAFQFIIKNNPEVLVFQWWTSSIGHLYLLFEILNKLFLHKKILIEFHEVVDPLEDSILPIRLYSRFIGRILTKNVFAIAHSEADKNLIFQNYNLPKERIFVIPHGPYDHFNKIDKKEAKKNIGIEEEFILLYFGLIREYKGVEYLIDAFNKISGTEIEKIRLLIVGEIWDDIDLEKKRECSPHKEKITIRNEYVPDEEVSLFFSASDVVILPYLRASQSGVAHIAITYKLPIIVSKVGGLVESMSEYEGTIFIPPADSEAIKKEILSLVNGGFKKDIKSLDLSWDKISKRYQEILEKI